MSSDAPASSETASPPFETAGLDRLPALLWQHLQAATESAKHPFHLPTLCTVDPDQHPAARVVVLRRVEPGTHELICHTDRRAPKIAELRANPATAWLFYDGPAKLQLRVTGRSSVHTDDALADAQWDASTLSSRRCYLAPAAPGDAVLDDAGNESATPSPNLPEALRHRVPTAAEAAPGRVNFAVIRTVVQRFDALVLHHAGHRRAEFLFTPTQEPPTVARWLEA